MSGKVIT